MDHARADLVACACIGDSAAQARIKIEIKDATTANCFVSDITRRFIPEQDKTGAAKGKGSHVPAPFGLG